MEPIKGTITTKSDNKVVPYYPQTSASQVLVSMGLDGEYTTLEQKLDDYDKYGTGGGGGTVINASPIDVTNKSIIAEESGQKTFTIPDEEDIEHLDISLHTNSVWISPDQYSKFKNQIIFGDTIEGLEKGEKLYYTILRGEVGPNTIAMDSISFVVQGTNDNEFLIEKKDYSQEKYTVVPIIGGTVIVKDRFTIIKKQSNNFIRFNDYQDGITTGTSITLLFFNNIAASNVINGGRIIDEHVSLTLDEDTNELKIPLQNFDPNQHKFLMFIGSTFIAPRCYTVDFETNTVILNEDQGLIQKGRIIDFVFLSISKNGSTDFLVTSKKYDELYTNIVNMFDNFSSIYPFEVCENKFIKAEIPNALGFKATGIHVTGKTVKNIVKRDFYDATGISIGDNEYSIDSTHNRYHILIKPNTECLSINMMYNREVVSSGDKSCYIKFFDNTKTLVNTLVIMENGLWEDYKNIYELSGSEYEVVFEFFGYSPKDCWNISLTDDKLSVGKINNYIKSTLCTYNDMTGNSYSVYEDIDRTKILELRSINGTCDSFNTDKEWKGSLNKHIDNININDSIEFNLQKNIVSEEFPSNVVLFLPLTNSTLKHDDVTCNIFDTCNINDIIQKNKTGICLSEDIQGVIFCIDKNILGENISDEESVQLFKSYLINENCQIFYTLDTPVIKTIQKYCIDEIPLNKGYNCLELKDNTITSLEIYAPSEKYVRDYEYTYDELDYLVNHKLLIPGQMYILSDYRTKYVQPITNRRKEADNIEKLILHAITCDKFNNICSSIDFPKDIVYYDFDAAYTYYSDDSKTRNGYIYHRIYKSGYGIIDYCTDWRTVRYVRKKFNNINCQIDGKITPFSIWEEGKHVKYDEVYIHNNAVYVVVQDALLIMPPSSPTDKYFFKCIFSDLDKYLNSSQYLPIGYTSTGKKITLIASSDPYEEFNTFENINQVNYIHSNIHNHEIPPNNVFFSRCSNINIHSGSTINNTFYKSENIYVDYNCIHNLITQCTNINIGMGCDDNMFSRSNNIVVGNACDKNCFTNSYRITLGSSCFNNTICHSGTINLFSNCSYNKFGISCNDITLYSSCSSNKFGDRSNNIIIGSSCTDNIFGYYCSCSSLGSYCKKNVFGDRFNYNLISNSCTDNTFGSCNQYITMLCNSSNNTFGDNFSHLYIIQLENKNISLISDLIAKQYTINILKRQDNQYVYWYLNSSNVPVYTQIP